MSLSNHGTTQIWCRLTILEHFYTFCFYHPSASDKSQGIELTHLWSHKYIKICSFSNFLYSSIPVPWIIFILWTWQLCSHMFQIFLFMDMFDLFSYFFRCPHASKMRWGSFFTLITELFKSMVGIFKYSLQTSFPDFQHQNMTWINVSKQYSLMGETTLTIYRFLVCVSTTIIYYWNISNT